MSEHTPGPWTAFIGDDKNTVAVQVKHPRHGGTIDLIQWMGFDNSAIPYEQHVANANLIAAAPELLEALKDFVRHKEVLAITFEAWKSEGRAEAAIKKAEGRK